MYSINKNNNFIVIFFFIIFISICGHSFAEVSGDIFSIKKSGSVSNGTPRFKKEVRPILYFSIGAGTNLANYVDLRSTGLNQGMVSSVLGSGSDLSHAFVNVTGFPALAFGHIPYSAPFLRQEISVSFILGTVSNPVTSANPVNIQVGETNESYSSAELKIDNVRIAYNLYAQYIIPSTPVSLFAGIGIGLYIGNSYLNGTKAAAATTVPDAATTSPSAGESALLSSAAGVVSLTYDVVGGFTVNFVNNLTVEVKAKYVFVNKPSEALASLPIFLREGLELTFSIMIKV